jgi:hypothetical protein
MGDAWETAMARAVRPLALQRRRDVEAGEPGRDDPDQLRARQAVVRTGGLGRFDRGLRRHAREHTGMLDWLAAGQVTEPLRVDACDAMFDDITIDLRVGGRDWPPVRELTGVELLDELAAPDTAG